MELTAPVPPGKATITRCHECRGAGCYECKSTGYLIWRACPRCGDRGWHYTQGLNDREGMDCWACSYHWTRDDPGWLAQRIPARS